MKARMNTIGLFFAMAFFAASVAAAAPVDAARAKRAAGRWLVARPAAHLTAKLSKDVAAVTTATNSVGGNAYHVASLSGGGYVVIGQDCDANGQPVFPPQGLPDKQLDKIQRELLAHCQLIQP